MNIGISYRNLRKERGLTLMDVTTTGELSYSQLSKFERGETSITIHHLVNLVHNLGISFAEFMTVIEEYNSPYKFYIEEIDSAYKTNDINKLRQIVRLQESSFVETGLIFFRYNAIMTKILINDLVSIEIEDEEKILISEYIINCSIWTTYEIILLGNSFRGLTTALQETFVREMIRKLPNIKEGDIVKNHIFNILINVCFDRLRKGKSKNVKKILSAIKPELSTNAYYFKIRVLFLDGLIQIMEGQFEEGVKSCERAIDIFALFDKAFEKLHKKELDTYRSIYS
ncbi:helix-turn-helix domain-containing protein [Aerococcus urinaeequi]|uniref:helix-turn-helix domain-containing protein n=1 Tax=Aerococcus urinaeequi TaxID=51665 RepID=UPI003D6B19B1